MPALPAGSLAATSTVGEPPKVKSLPFPLSDPPAVNTDVPADRPANSTRTVVSAIVAWSVSSRCPVIVALDSWKALTMKSSLAVVSTL